MNWADMKKSSGIKYLSLFFLLFWYGAVTHAATDSEKIQQILSLSTAPSGVVFEIASSDKDALQWAIPRIQEYTERLRQQFPGLDVAIVSHGREQFLLQEKNAKENEKVHKAVKELSTKGDIPVHICQTFAAWNNVDPEEFPDYVSVSTTGPQQVKDYLELGYYLVKLKSR